MKLVQLLFDESRWSFVVGAVLIVLFFAVQLVLCLKLKRLVLKLIPIFLLLPVIPLCIVLCVTDFEGFYTELWAYTAAFIIGIIAVMALLGDALAWGIYKIYNKRSNSLQG